MRELIPCCVFTPSPLSCGLRLPRACWSPRPWTPPWILWSGLSRQQSEPRPPPGIRPPLPGHLPSSPQAPTSLAAPPQGPPPEPLILSTDCWRPRLCPQICSHPPGDLIRVPGFNPFICRLTSKLNISPQYSPQILPPYNQLPIGHPLLEVWSAFPPEGPEATHVVPSFCSPQLCPISGHDLSLIPDSSLHVLRQHQRASPNIYPKMHPESDRSPPPLLPSSPERHL